MRGKEGTLNTVLVTPNELDEIEKVVGNKNIVVAIGDSKIIFEMPNLITYIYDYISEVEEQNIEILLRFIASKQTNSRLPFKKYVTEKNIIESNLFDEEKDKLRERLRKYNSFEEQRRTIPKHCRERYDSLASILENKFPEYRECDVISYNANKLELNDIKEYLLNKFTELKDNGGYKISSQLRRLALIYDLKQNM